MDGIFSLFVYLFFRNFALKQPVFVVYGIKALY